MTHGSRYYLGFDPVRQEVARLALERLIADGRIHPARIERWWRSPKKWIPSSKMKENRQLEVGIHGLHPELIRFRPPAL